MEKTKAYRELIDGLVDCEDFFEKCVGMIAYAELEQKKFYALSQLDESGNSDAEKARITIDAVECSIDVFKTQAEQDLLNAMEGYASQQIAELKGSLHEELFQDAVTQIKNAQKTHWGFEILKGIVITVSTVIITGGITFLFRLWKEWRPKQSANRSIEHPTISTTQALKMVTVRLLHVLY